jgi:hypothetical protein
VHTLGRLDEYIIADALTDGRLVVTSRLVVIFVRVMVTGMSDCGRACDSEHGFAADFVFLKSGRGAGAFS